jgi:transcriptional regulator with XRE-family HTH domain
MAPSTNRANLRTTWLGKLLREQREERAMSLDEVGAYIGRSGSILSKMENGKLPFRDDDVTALLALYGLQDPVWQESVLRLHQQRAVRAWWDVYSEAVAEPVIDVVWLESLATAIGTFSATVFDGLLQTAEYAAAVDTAAAGGGTEPDVDRWVELVTMRQAVLAKRNAPTFSAVIDEALLYRPVGGPVVLADQLRHVLTLGRRPHVDIRVLPFAASAHASLMGSFRTYQLPEPLSEAASAICPLGELFVEPPRSASSVTAYGLLQEASLSPSESAELITETVRRLEIE